MSKIIIKFPFAIKSSRLNEMARIAREQWEKGILIVNGFCDVIIRPDTDVLEVQWDENREHDLDWLCRLRSTLATGALNDSAEHVEEYKEALDHVIDKMLYKKELKEENDEYRS